MTERDDLTTRRRVLQVAASLGAASVAGCGGTAGNAEGGTAGSDGDGTGTRTEGSSGDGGPTPTSYDGWLSDVQNYDGSPTDRTGTDTITVAVGAGNGLLFDPAAVRVSPGTTVVWEWTGQGGQHNVRAEDGSFESELYTEAGRTFERTFDDPGVVPYLCVPHQAVGMKGVVDVVDG